MKTKTIVRVNIAPAGKVLTRLGVDNNGDIQRFVTATINKNLTRYMPYSTGALATKLKYIKSPTEIEVVGPYARMQYYPWVMVDAKTGRGPFPTDDGPRYHVGAVLKPSGIKKVYDKSGNPEAGPYWDKRMMAARRAAITAEINAYAKRGVKV